MAKTNTNAVVNQQDAIKVIDDPVNAVRQLPDVYIGALGNHGYLNMFREFLQNCFDEIIKGNTLDLNIKVTYDARTKICIIEDNGQGIDHPFLEAVYTVLHSSSNYEKKAGSGRYSSGKNGMGATISNFLSKSLKVISYRSNGNPNDPNDGKALMIQFKEGRTEKKEAVKCPAGKHGVYLEFIPSDMMGEITVDDIELHDFISSIIPLNKLGTTVLYSAIDINGKAHTTTITNKNGIHQLMDNMSEVNLVEPIHILYDNGTMKIETLLTWDAANLNDPYIKGYANMCPTDDGTHIAGFTKAVTKYFCDYMNKKYLVSSGNKKKLVVNKSDVMTGMRAIVSCFHLFPLFTGQSKEIFSKEDMLPFANEIVYNGLDEWVKTNPSSLQKICKNIKDVCEIRSKNDDEKVKLSTNYTTSILTGLPESYIAPRVKKNIEVIIVEGKSARGGLINNRDNNQGIMPIRGKLPNALTTPTAKFFANEEIAGLCNIFGYKGYSKKFDPAKFIPEKVILAMDGDADGAHIRSLAFMFFLRYFPFVITEGKLYFAQAPLYGAEIGKKMRFFNDNYDFAEYLRDLFSKEYLIADMKERAYTKDELRNIFMNNLGYADLVTNTANTYKIDPIMLEFLLINKDLDFKSFKNLVEKTYKTGQVKVTNENGTIMIRGLVNNKWQTIFFNHRLLDDCGHIIEALSKFPHSYLVSGEYHSLFQLIKKMRSYMPKNIRRFKGLGEMEPVDLGNSTIKSGNRTLVRYTTQNYEADLKKIKAMQDDKAIFVRNVKVKREDIV